MKRNSEQPRVLLIKMKNVKKTRVALQSVCVSGRNGTLHSGLLLWLFVTLFKFYV